MIDLLQTGLLYITIVYVGGVLLGAALVKVLAGFTSHGIGTLDAIITCLAWPMHFVYFMVSFFK